MFYCVNINIFCISHTFMSLNFYITYECYLIIICSFKRITLILMDFCFSNKTFLYLHNYIKKNCVHKFVVYVLKK